MIPHFRLACGVALAAAGSAGSAAAVPSGPTFDPLVFFAGRTEGRGSLKIMLSRARSVTVHGRGRVEPDGTLVLEQTVIEGDKAPADRRWTFRPAGPGRYTGTLTDAAGPVAGDVAGSRLHLHFRMHGRITADQRLDLAPDGQSAHNRMTFRKMGMVVARLDETIVRRP